MYTDSQNGYASLAYEELLGEPHSGDFDQGAGVSTSQLQNPNVSLDSSKAGTATKGPIFSWGVAIIIGVMLFIVKLLQEKNRGETEFSTTRIGLENWFIVGTMAATFIYVMHMVAYVWVKKGPFVQFAGSV